MKPLFVIYSFIWSDKIYHRWVFFFYFVSFPYFLLTSTQTLPGQGNRYLRSQLKVLLRIYYSFTVRVFLTKSVSLSSTVGVFLTKSVSFPFILIGLHPFLEPQKFLSLLHWPCLVHSFCLCFKSSVVCGSRTTQGSSHDLIQEIQCSRGQPTLSTNDLQKPVINLIRTNPKLTRPFDPLT